LKYFFEVVEIVTSQNVNFPKGFHVSYPLSETLICYPVLYPKD